MRIGINTLFLTPGQVGGTEVYLYQLVDALGQIDAENEYLLYVAEQNQGIFSHLPFSNFREIVIKARYSPVLQKGLQLSGWLDAQVGRQILNTGVDLVHYPGTTIAPLSLALPCVLTIHDIQQEYYPQFFSWRERLRRRRSYQVSAQKARQIIAISEFTRQTLLEKYHLDAHKITTIHCGVAHDFFTPVEPQLIGQVIQKYDLPEQFALFPARGWPHKNHQSLFEAMGKLKTRYASPCKLVLCGLAVAELPHHLQHLLENELRDTILILGYVSRDDLRVLMQTATVVVYPSLFEGFGLPILEAMASGCPVICSNTTALPEIAGKAAMLVDPLDTEQLALAIQRVSTDKEMRSELIAQGLKQCQNFSWLQTAEKTLEVYKNVYASIGR